MLVKAPSKCQAKCQVCDRFSFWGEGDRRLIPHLDQAFTVKACREDPVFGKIISTVVLNTYLKGWSSS